MRVWSRRIGKGLEGSAVIEAFESSTIVVMNEAVEEGVSVIVGDEETMGDAALGLSADGFDDAAVERSTMPLVCGR